jgi:RNA polymerase sigma-70 factor, ECF subfamily
MVSRPVRASREQVTKLLTSWADGDARSENRLSMTLYRELRNLAKRQLRRRQERITLDTTDLIHEAYLKLVDGSRTNVRDRGHFLALSAQIMRQVVVDHVRRRTARKREGRNEDVPLDGIAAPLNMSAEDLLALDEVLGKLKTLDPRAAQLVDLRFFGGVSIDGAAEILGISITTAKRDWERTRAFLYKELRRQPAASDGPPRAGSRKLSAVNRW